jgi:ribonuclease P protein component
MNLLMGRGAKATIRGLFCAPEEQTHETYLSTQAWPQEAHSRLPRTHGIARRPPRARAPPRQGPQETDSLTVTLAFPPALRLRQPREFEKVLAGGIRLNEKLLTLAVGASPLDTARMGLAISAKAVPRAVDRNRIKRAARESFRLNRAQLPPRDLVVLARSGAGKAEGSELRATLERLWQKLRAR